MADTLDYHGKTPAGHKPDAQDAHEHVDPLKSYLIVFVSLLGLLLLTVFAYQFDMGMLNTFIALVIASIKGLLVMLVFMHLRHGTKLTWVIASTGFLWLCIMITFFYADYLSRDAIPEQVIRPASPVAEVSAVESAKTSGSMAP
jgi:cytochrome c oxidase subunit 4